jgi:hypothetical protein
VEIPCIKETIIIIIIIIIIIAIVVLKVAFQLFFLFCFACGLIVSRPIDQVARLRILWLVIFSGTEIFYLFKQLVMKNCKESQAGEARKIRRNVMGENGADFLEGLG